MRTAGFPLFFRFVGSPFCFSSSAFWVIEGVESYFVLFGVRYGAPSPEWREGGGGNYGMIPPLLDGRRSPSPRGRFVRYFVRHRRRGEGCHVAFLQYQNAQGGGGWFSTVPGW